MRRPQSRAAWALDWGGSSLKDRKGCGPCHPQGKVPVKNTTSGSSTLLPWQLPSWDGQPVETRPADAGPEWPEDAVERVTFRLEDCPDETRYIREELPHTLYFGEDGWPLGIPEGEKPFLDPEAKAELRRRPLLVHLRQLQEGELRGLLGNIQHLREVRAMARVFRAVKPLLPVPGPET